MHHGKWKKHYSFYYRAKKWHFFPYFYCEIIFYRTELWDCTLNIKFCWDVFIFLNININQTTKEQDLNCIRNSHLMWEQLYGGVLELKCQACALTKKWTPFWAFLRILACFKKFTKILKVGKVVVILRKKYLKLVHIFWCVTLCYHKLILETPITNINNFLTMIGMRALWHHFYIELIC